MDLELWIFFIFKASLRNIRKGVFLVFLRILLASAEKGGKPHGEKKRNV